MHLGLLDPLYWKYEYTLLFVVCLVGIVDKAMATVLSEINLELARVPNSKLLPKPPGHETPLRLQVRGIGGIT